MKNKTQIILVTVKGGAIHYDCTLIVDVINELENVINSSTYITDSSIANIAMLQWGDNSKLNRSQPHLGYNLLEISTLQESLWVGYTTNYSRASKSLTSHTNNAYIFSQFCMNEKTVTQLPVAIIRPNSVLAIDQLTLFQNERILSYREDQKFHCINSLRNLYLNLMLNDNIPLLDLNPKFSFKTLEIETILKGLEQKDSQLANNFERCIKEVQNYLSSEELKFSEETKAKILTKIINTEVVNLKAMDQEPTINNFIKYNYMKKNF